MKVKEIVKDYSLDMDLFMSWLPDSGFKVKNGLTGLDVEETNIDSVVQSFNQYCEHRSQSDKELQLALSNILITSGFNFDGYTITKYSGYISGDDAVQVGRGQQGFFGGGITNVGDSLMASLTQIRRKALSELKQSALALGCNAVIGVDFDYLTLDPQTADKNGGTIYLPYVFGVTANGNAVIIEKN